MTHSQKKSLCDEAVFEEVYTISQFYAAFRKFEKMTPREYYLKTKRRRR